MTRGSSDNDAATMVVLLKKKRNFGTQSRSTCLWHVVLRFFDFDFDIGQMTSITGIVPHMMACGKGARFKVLRNQQVAKINQRSARAGRAVLPLRDQARRAAVAVGLTAPGASP